MTTRPIVEIGEGGELKLPEELLRRVKPHTRFEVELQGDTLVLSPTTERKRFSEMATPEERARAWREWIEHFQDEDAPALSDWAVSRDSIYD